MSYAAIALAVIGLALLVVGVIYLATPSGSLPSFFPGHLAHVSRHHTKRGSVAIGLGILSFVAAFVTLKLSIER